MPIPLRISEPAPRCKHCRKNKPSKRRGLCHACHAIPYIRNAYPPLAPQGNKVYEFDTKKDIPMPKRSTTAAPGSEEKISVLAARFAARKALFHPSDSPLDMSRLNPAKVENMSEVDRASATKAKANPAELVKRHKKKLGAAAWNRWPCCLFGAACRGKCGCGSPSVLFVASGLARQGHRCRRWPATRETKDLFIQRRPSLPLPPLSCKTGRVASVLGKKNRRSVKP